MRLGGKTLPRVAFHTLGCKVNQHDTEGVAALFRRRGYEIVDFDAPADVVVINTCSVTNAGAKKSRQAIRRAIAQNPRAVVVAMGCYAQFAPDEVGAIQGLDIVVGTHRRAEIVDMVEEVMATRRPLRAVDPVFRVKAFEELPAFDFDGRTRATLKVQDGCNAFCSFCQIPWARGRNRSLPPERVEERVRRLAAAGFKEVVLTGVHLGTYGIDLDEPCSLAELIYRIHDTPGLERIRISSVDPHEVDEALIRAVAELPKVCRHLHIPAQSGDDEILLLMRRRNTTAEFLHLVERLRDRVGDHLAITTDVIVGFPQESEAHFERTLRFCREAGFSRIHVFPYSIRSGTLAARMPGHVEKAVKEERVERLIALSRELAAEFNRRLVGRTAAVLVERGGAAPGWVQGLTESYVRVTFPGEESADAGSLVDVYIDSADADGARGRRVAAGLPAGGEESRRGAENSIGY